MITPAILLASAALLVNPTSAPPIATSISLASSEQGAAVVEALEASAGGQALRERLGGLRPFPTAELFELVCRGSIPPDWLVSGKPSRTLSSEERVSVFLTLGDAPLSELEALLVRVALQEFDWRRRIVAMSLLSSVREAGTIPLLIRLTRHPGGSSVPVEVRPVFRQVLEHQLVIDEGEIFALLPLFEEIPPSLFAQALAAVGGSPARPAMEFLTAVLGREPELDPLVLSTLGKLAASSPRPFADEVLGAVREYLFHAEDGLLQAAARAAGNLGDYQAVPQLIELLTHHNENVRREAHTALCRITDLGFRLVVERWDRWYEEELAWWDQNAAEDLNAVRLGRSEEALRALRIIDTKRLYRDEIAAGVSEGLRHRDENVVMAVCGVLSHLHSELAREPLMRVAEEHKSPAVRAAAELALSSLGPLPGGHNP